MSIGVFASGAQALSGCGGDEQSAIMQYCESIPNATGGSPTPGGPKASTTPLLFSLPRSTDTSIIRSRKHLGLLAIPGPYRHTQASTSTPSVSAFDPLRILIIVLIAIALSLAFVAAWRRHRQTATA
jgi:hypothetical protein